jgi:hypothetical protein
MSKTLTRILAGGCLAVCLFVFVEKRFVASHKRQMLLFQGKTIVHQLREFQAMHARLPATLSELKSLPFDPNRAWIYTVTDKQSVILCASTGWIRESILCRVVFTSSEEPIWFLSTDGEVRPIN